MSPTNSFRLFIALAIGILAKDEAKGLAPPVDDFAPVQTFQVSTGAIGIASADLNGDGLLDIATANRWANNISILFGQPSGGFGSRIDIATGVRPEYLTTADFDGNGRSDLALANWQDHDVTVLLQQSNGSLSSAGRYPVGNHPHMIIAEDFNGDSRTDLATATSANAITVLYNQPLGGFGSRQDLPIDSVGFGLLTNDFNIDGLPDLATTLPNTGSMLNVLYGKAGGGFNNRIPYTPAANRPALATSSDFNGDSIPDLAYAGYSHHGSMVVLLGQASGGFILSAEYPEPSFAQAIVSSDFNLDGYVDVAASDYGSIWMYYGNGDGTFEDGLALNVGSTIGYLATSDLNGDGSMDIIATSGGTSWGEVYVLFNLNVVPEPSALAQVFAGSLVGLAYRNGSRCRRSTRNT